MRCDTSNSQFVEGEADKVAKKLPDVPKEEPSPPKAKAAAKPEDAADDDEWVQVDKPNIPKKVSVEDAEDEDDKKH